jgi:hypothetical protein
MRTNLSMSLLVTGCLIPMIGCAFPTVSFDRASNSQIKSIGLVRHVPPPPECKYAEMEKQQLASRSVFLIGGLFAILWSDAQQSYWDRQSGLDEVVRGTGFSPSSELTRALKSSLEASGYKVVVIETKHWVGDCSRFGGNVDACLHACESIGYTKKGNVIFPEVLVTVHLRTPSKTLYLRQIQYGPDRYPGICRLSVDEQYVFRGPEEFRIDPQKTIRGLKAGILAVAAKVGEDLK